MRFVVYYEYTEGRARAVVGMRSVALTSKVDRRLLFYLSGVVTSQRMPAGGGTPGERRRRTPSQQGRTRSSPQPRLRPAAARLRSQHMASDDV